MNFLKRLLFHLEWERHGAAEIASRRGIKWIIQPYHNGVIDGYTWIAFTGFPAVKVAQSDGLYFDKDKCKRIVRDVALRLEA